MDTFSLSPDCQHSKNGLCSKCVLNQSFSISPAEERHRRNLSNGSIRSTTSQGTLNGSTNQLNASLSPRGEEDLTSFPTLPVPLKAVQPQTEDELAVESDSYTSFAELDKFANVRPQQENNKEFVNTTTPLVEPPSLLMRFFESDLFSPSIAMQYLFSSKDRRVKAYLGEKLFSFPNSQMDFFIPQLINMYINDKDIASAVFPYIESRCRSSVKFALVCVWLLESFAVDRLKIKDRTMGHGDMLRQMILNDFRTPPSVGVLRKDSGLGSREKMQQLSAGSLLSPASLDSGLHLTRSESAASSLRCLNLTPSTLSNGRCLDTGCRCFEDVTCEACECGADRLSAEKEFISWLTRIGSRLTEEPSKGEKTRRLVSELLLMNMHLPARVWIPLADDHIVLRIPPTNSCVLNSKDKAPYCIYVEILKCDDVLRVPIPKSLSEAESELHLRLRSSSITSPTDSNPTYSASLENRESNSELRDIPVVECRDDDSVVETLPEGDLVPDPAWDSMSLDSSASEPVLRNGRLQPAELGRRLKQWVKPGRRKRQMRPHPDDPSASTMSEPWEEKRERIRQQSPYGRMSGWDLLPVIVKSGDDLAQELLAYQLLVTLKSIWDEEQVNLYLRPCRILVTSPDSGMIEPIVDACSLHQIKRNQQALHLEENRVGAALLESHFIETFGPKGTGSYLNAQQNFVQSCAAYSLVCYFLQVKDRHNGNILIDSEGHLIHIDFGFILSVSPKNLGFETSPFKLTTELVEVMGGQNSDMYFYFKTCLLKGILAARKHQDRIMTIIEIMSKGSHLPCFRGGLPVLQAMRDRFHVTYTDKQLENLVNSMVDQSLDSLTTRMYDNFQYYTNNIL